MYAARKNRIRLRTTFSLMIVAMIVGGIITLSLIQQEIARLKQASLIAPQTTGQKIDWVEAISVFGEEVIQLFISVTSETR